jgi:hypothetical protein
MQGEAKVKAEWEGDKLVIEGEQQMRARGGQRGGGQQGGGQRGGGGTMTVKVTDVWELADGGSVLIQNRTMETPRGARETKTVFDKQ